MKIKHLEEQTLAYGLSDFFSGTVIIDSAFQTPEPARTGGAIVTFEPMARTHWHRHPLGQILIVTAGLGFVQSEGQEIKQIRAGDIVWINPNEKHWHGASTTLSMTHIAIAESMDGSPVEWLEKVSSEDYLA